MQKEAAEAAKRKKEEEDAKLHTKGKPSSFFIIEYDGEGNPQLNTDQKNFIFLHYISYSDPSDMLMIIDWLHGNALELEAEAKRTKDAYSKPSNSGKRNTTKKQSEEYEVDYDEESSFGYTGGKKKNTKQVSREPPKPRKRKNEGAEGEAKEEKKQTKAERVKDVEVTVDEDNVVEVDESK